MSANKCRAPICSVVLGLALTSASFDAKAASTSGNVTHVEYNENNGTPQILTQIGGTGQDGTNYIGQQPSPGCSLPAISVDTIKVWLSLLQSALLSGVNTQIYYTTCGTTNYIADVVLYN
jgi:hypothetical protein